MNRQKSFYPILVVYNEIFYLVKATFITYYKLVESLHFSCTQSKFHIEINKTLQEPIFVAFKN